MRKHWSISRRRFLGHCTSGLGLLAWKSAVPSLLPNVARAQDRAAEARPPILVLLQLAGGNDGLNTLVPFEDDAYYRARPRLALPKNDLIKLTDQLGLHPACVELGDLYRSGQLAIIQNVGYPNPNRSHFRSMEIWETASDSDEFLPSGWIGRYLDLCCQPAAMQRF